MVLEALGFGGGEKKAVRRRTAVFLSTRERWAQVLETALSAQGFDCRRLTHARRLVRKLPCGELAVLLWDTATVEPDLQMISGLDAGTTVLLFGHCPTVDFASISPTVLTVPSGDADLHSNGLIRLVSGAYITIDALKDAEAALGEREKQTQEAVRLSERLREHCEFYELQRNRLSETVRRTAYLGQLSKEINCLDVDRIVEICLTKMPHMVDAKLASVYFHNEENRELVLKGSNHPYPVTERISLDEAPQSVMSVAINRKATLLIRDMDAFQKGLPERIDRTYSSRYSTGSCIIVPLASGQEIIGVMNLADKTDGTPFDEIRDLPLVDHISQFIGIALGNCRLYEKVSLQARTDGLTNFINHNAFFDELNREIERARRRGSNLSLILLDVDNFKLFNDIHGHQMGDKILQQVAGTIKQSTRAVDVPARYGGDEFAVICGDTDLKRGALVAERIRRAVASNPMKHDDKAFSVTISAGVAEYEHGLSAADMVERVDSALYLAKSRGRNAVAADQEVAPA